MSYGTHGGDKASDSLKTSLEALFTHVVETRPMLPFAKNEPFEYGVPLDLRLAWEGRLGEQSVKEWGEKKSEIAKGFGELMEYLATDIKSST